MNKVAIIFWSGTGNTEKMADKVAEGAKSSGAEVDIFTASEFSSDKIDNYDAFAFGCPSMGSEVLEESEFEPMFSECEAKLKGKKLALFGSYGWGDGQWMRDWEDRCASNNIILSYESVICNGEPDTDTEAECIALGQSLV